MKLILSIITSCCLLSCTFIKSCEPVLPAKRASLATLVLPERIAQMDPDAPIKPQEVEYYRYQDYIRLLTFEARAHASKIGTYTAILSDRTQLYGTQYRTYRILKKIADNLHTLVVKAYKATEAVNASPEKQKADMQEISDLSAQAGVACAEYREFTRSENSLLDQELRTARQLIDIIIQRGKKRPTKKYRLLAQKALDNAREHIQYLADGKERLEEVEKMMPLSPDKE